jgi:hypothetical protein
VGTYNPTTNGFFLLAYESLNAAQTVMDLRNRGMLEDLKGHPMKLHTRRPHRKTKTGCQSCKRRKIKVSRSRVLFVLGQVLQLSKFCVLRSIIQSSVFAFPRIHQAFEKMEKLGIEAFLSLPAMPKP